MKYPLLKQQLIRDGYSYRSSEYLSEYTRRINGREPITWEQKLNWYRVKRKPLKRTDEYRREYMKIYNREYQKKYRELYVPKKRLTMNQMLDKIQRMREEQNIIL